MLPSLEVNGEAQHGPPHLHIVLKLLRACPLREIDVQDAIAGPQGDALRHLVGQNRHHIPGEMRARAEAADVPAPRDQQSVDDVHFEPCPQKWVNPIFTPVDVGEVFDRNASVEMDKAPSRQKVDRL
jgi:hypothetical protein